MKIRAMIVSYGLMTLTQPTLPIQAVSKKHSAQGKHDGAREGNFGELVQFVEGIRRLGRKWTKQSVGLRFWKGVEGDLKDMDAGE